MAALHFNFGMDKRLTLGLPTQVRCWSPSPPEQVVRPRDRWVSDHELQCEPGCQALRERIRAAVAQPVGHPSLTDSVFPDDRLAIAVGPQVPHPGILTEELVRCLIEGGARASKLEVLVADEHGLDRAIQQQLAHSTHQVRVTKHNPRDRTQLTYIAADTHARPLYFHRALHDADFVVALLSLREPDPTTYGGEPIGLFPCFSDESSRKRFQGLKPNGARRAQQEIHQANWLTGIRFVVWTIPALEAGLPDIVAGDTDLTRSAAVQIYCDSWSIAAPQRFEAIVAGLTGPDRDQTSENLLRCVAAAERILTEHGTLLLCTDLREVQPTAVPLLRSLGERRRCYLLSQLDPNEVEDLGLIPVDGEQEATRLLGKVTNIALLEHAHLYWPTVRHSANAWLPATAEE